MCESWINRYEIDVRQRNETSVGQFITLKNVLNIKLWEYYDSQWLLQLSSMTIEQQICSQLDKYSFTVEKLFRYWWELHLVFSTQEIYKSQQLEVERESHSTKRHWKNNAVNLLDGRCVSLFHNVWHKWIPSR